MRFRLSIQANQIYLLLFSRSAIICAVFIVLFFWYTLFDTSGLIAVSRYLILNNVLSPLLVVYYGIKTAQLWKEESVYF